MARRVGGVDCARRQRERARASRAFKEGTSLNHESSVRRPQNGRPDPLDVGISLGSQTLAALSIGVKIPQSRPFPKTRHSQHRRAHTKTGLAIRGFVYETIAILHLAR